MRTLITSLAAVGTALVLACGAAHADAPKGAQANLGLDGRIILSDGTEDLGTLSPIMAGTDWQFGQNTAKSFKQQGETRQFILRVGKQTVSGEAKVTGKGGSADAQWSFTADTNLDVACLAVSADFSAGTLAGGSYKADGKSGEIPAQFGDVRLFNAEVRSLALTTRNGKTLQIAFPEPTPVLIQDNRQWTDSFSIRMGKEATKLAKGGKYEVPMTLSMAGGITTGVASNTVITANADWIPLKTELEIEPGSAVDLSKMGFVDAPCGKQGWIVANTDGHFAFENDPNTARRFYGVNFCFDSLYISHDEADRLCDRLVRLGYNTIRVHHYEGKLTEGRPGFDWKAENWDKLDYLLAACQKRGIYVTTDLYVSRPVGGTQIGLPGNISMNEFKVLVPVYEPAYKDWQTFSTKLMTHVNPYTKLRLADDPTIAWLSMINEGNFGNYWKEIKAIPQWKTAWNTWLSKRYADRAALAKAWDADLKADEDAANGTVALPDGVYGATPRHRDCTIFLGETERDMFVRMETFLRNEIKTRALLTNMNSWTNHVPSQMARAEFDYVDDHFYVDHPQFIERDWNLPSRCDNANPVRQGAPGGRGGNTVRLLDKPFTVTEYNYAGPGRYRGVGGILTGAMGALQNWDGIWRFAYSHSNQNLFRPSTMSYFDLVTDPLNQAADRAAVMLYLRGDLKPNPGKVAIALTKQDMENPPAKVSTMTEGPAWITWITGLGSVIVDGPRKAPKDALLLPTGWSGTTGDGLTAFGTDKAKLMQALRAKGILPAGNVSDPAKNIFESQTGEMLMDGSRGLLQFDTERTAGGYADPGVNIESKKGGVTISDLSIGATVFVTSVDGQPIKSSQRLLVTHLTDLQDTDITYAEQARQTLLSWGKLPHLVRAGTAKVRIAVKDPGSTTVYGIACSGKRLGEVPHQVVNGAIEFTCDVKGPDGARMLYEVTAK